MDPRAERRNEFLKGELNDRQVELIKVDLETAFTFATIANDADGDAQKRERNTYNARRGYDTVLRYMKTAVMGADERTAINERAGELRDLLSGLGETFSD
jgi:hypothetical protein